MFGLAVGWMFWWLGNNPLMDGYQNEYLHIGNAYDLWGALQSGDVWHLRYYMYTGYWPFGFYIVPWPIMGFSGMGRNQLVAGNIIHLVVMFYGCWLLHRRFTSPLLFPLLFCLVVFLGPRSRDRFLDGFWSDFTQVFMNI